MKKLDKEEMKSIVGGGSSTISGTLLNGIYKTLDIIYSIGESLGSYIRRKVEGNMCDL